MAKYKFNIIINNVKKALFFLIISQILFSCKNSNNLDKFNYLPKVNKIDYNININNIIYSIDRNELNSYIQSIVSEEIITQENIDKIDISRNLENLHHINILGYLKNNIMYVYNKILNDERIIDYIITVEIGYGISPLASENGNSCYQIYKENIVYNDKNIGTVRIWQMENTPIVDFIFVIFDKEYNIYYKYIGGN